MKTTSLVMHPIVVAFFLPPCYQADLFDGGTLCASRNTFIGPGS